MTSIESVRLPSLRSPKGLLIFVVGGQYGSEGKGLIANHLSSQVDMAVSAKAANSGHTFYYRGEAQTTRHLPSAWTNPEAQLIIGRGSMISPDVFFEEIETVEQMLPVRGRLSVDPKAHVITNDQIRREAESDLSARIDSASSHSRLGIGNAMADKVLRLAGCVQAKDYPPLWPYLKDTVKLINNSLHAGRSVLVEGSQGLWLSLEHGDFPFVTSRDTSVMASAASIGVPLHHFPLRIIMATRSYPIRTGGENSGPFAPNSQEQTWQQVSQKAGCPEVLEESGSVTGRKRRIASFSMNQFVDACEINQPTEIALTFADYIDWRVHNQRKLTPPVLKFISQLEQAANGPRVSMVTTGPDTVIYR